jgi:uncharacterized Zn finger protein
VDTIRIAHPAPPTTTRELRGLELYREHGDEITHEGHGVYTVPGCSGGTYTVDLAIGGGEESCNCPDFERHKEPCKHVYAATTFRARARATARRVQADRTKARASRGNLAPLAAAL